MRVALAAALLLAVAGCGGGKAPTFNKVGGSPATAPASAVKPPPSGSSDVSLSGAMTYRTTTDFQCSYAKDDFFIRGTTGAYDGIPVYISINVEFFKKPGTYADRTQVLIRRVSDDAQGYESWYSAKATSTVLPRGQGVDLRTVTLAPEGGTAAKAPLTVGGHFGCLAEPSPGPG
jgi:hypothetical protein